MTMMMGLELELGLLCRRDWETPAYRETTARSCHNADCRYDHGYVYGYGPGFLQRKRAVTSQGRCHWSSGLGGDDGGVKTKRSHCWVGERAQLPGEPSPTDVATRRTTRR